MPNYDECLIAYKDRGNVGHFGAADPRKPHAAGRFLRIGMLLDGRMIGSWRRSVGRSGVAPEVVAYRTLTGACALDDSVVTVRAVWQNTAATVSQCSSPLRLVHRPACGPAT